MSTTSTILENAKSWLSDFFDPGVRKEIKDLLENDPDELKDRFYKTLEFGTGGMRGIMGTGTNRINKYTLGKSTQGLSTYLKKVYGPEGLKVVIAYDCRHNSQTLARTVAEVFSANGIRVYLFSELRTTPELSFAVRHLGCQAGVVLTASHNPPESRKVFSPLSALIPAPVRTTSFFIGSVFRYSQPPFHLKTGTGIYSLNAGWILLNLNHHGRNGKYRP